MTTTKRSKRKRNLTDAERLDVYTTLLRFAGNGSLPWGIFKGMADDYGCARTTISRIWYRGQRDEIKKNEFIDREDMFLEYENVVIKLGDVLSRRKGRCGRKQTDRELVFEAVEKLPYQQRGCLRQIEEATGINKNVLNRVLKHATIKVKPLLTSEHKKKRKEWAMKFVDMESQQFEGMYDYVHIDEKWFYMMREKTSVWLYDGEAMPNIACQSKRFIGKVMFICAVARPRKYPGTDVWWDGKIGMWPFTEEVPAQRGSKNRVKGTIETKSINVTKPVFLEYLTELIIPAIKEKWIEPKEHVIFIQQDNATPHVKGDNQAVVEAGTSDGWNIKLVNQPAQSPDVNVCDLGVFNSIQAAKYRSPTPNISSLVTVVLEAFQQIKVETLDNIFHTLFHVFECIIANDGHNHFRIPHQGKAKKRRAGTLSKLRTIDPLVFEKLLFDIDEAYLHECMEEFATGTPDEQDLEITINNPFQLEQLPYTHTFPPDDFLESLTPAWFHPNVSPSSPSDASSLSQDCYDSNDYLPSSPSVSSSLQSETSFEEEYQEAVSELSLNQVFKKFLFFFSKQR